ncbi:VTT domain-containing protein [Dyadobacter jiangsuensis]
MEILNQIVDLFIHLDEHLGQIVEDYGTLTYLLLFAIIFIETGVVFMPFLPGDSLLFAAGMLAAKYPDSLNIWLLVCLLLIAAILGDTSNYLVGRYLGAKALNFKLGGRSLIKPEHLLHTQGYFQRYGPSTIVIARFVPIVRTLAPFVGGIARMEYRSFIKFNIWGGVIWVTTLCLAGYFLGSVPIVKENFEKVILLIVALSVLPILWQLINGQSSIKQAEKTF